MPAVSILMPNYNSALYLGQAIQSVINQTFGDWELIICDDGSDDNSLDVALNFSDIDERVRVFETNGRCGAAVARNICLSKAAGRYVAFLDSDDAWEENKLELQIAFMKENSLAFTYTYYDVVDEDNRYLKTYKAPKKVDLRVMRLANFIPCLTVVYDSAVLGKVSQPEIKKRNDFALWLKILNDNRNLYAHCLPVVTAKYRQNNYGLSSGKLSTLPFFRECLVSYASVSGFMSYWFTGQYVCIYILKSRSVRMYNRLVTLI